MQRARCFRLHARLEGSTGGAMASSLAGLNHANRQQRCTRRLVLAGPGRARAHTVTFCEALASRRSPLVPSAGAQLAASSLASQESLHTSSVAMCLDAIAIMK
jgi:hypothetical protein